MPLRIGGGKDCDGGTDGSFMGGMAKMMKAGLVDFLFGGGSAGIQNVQLRPKKTADASDAVSPGEPASIPQFRKGERVGAGFLDFPGDLSQAVGGGVRSPFFFLQELEECLCGLGQREGL